MYNRRPNPYQSLYHQKQANQMNPYAYHPRPRPKQSYQPYVSPYKQSSYQKTPFQQYAKPKQPMNWYYGNQGKQQPNYQKQNHMQTANNLMAHFQDDNGKVDIDKMFSTVGNLANTVQQVSPVIKQVGSFMKNFK